MNSQFTALIVSAILPLSACYNNPEPRPPAAEKIDSTLGNYVPCRKNIEEVWKSGAAETACEDKLEAQE